MSQFEFNFNQKIESNSDDTDLEPIKDEKAQNPFNLTDNEVAAIDDKNDLPYNHY